jgi:hypothetical protein
VGVVSARAELAAGLLLMDDPWPDRATVIAQATDELRRRLHPTSVWQSGYLPPELRGRFRLRGGSCAVVPTRRRHTE